MNGHYIGVAAVHTPLAFFLIYNNEATGGDVVNLAKYVSQSVAKRFDIILEPEVRFIGRQGEVNAMDYIQ